MAQKTTGALVFDERTDRYDIRFDLASYYGGLHCGDCFDVFTRGKWKPTRIEMNMKQEWYLVGIRADDLNGLRVLFIILVLVTLLTNAMMNTSCAMLVTPLFIPIVQAFGMNTTAVAIAICVAASAPFLTPVGSGTWKCHD